MTLFDSAQSNNERNLQRFAGTSRKDNESLACMLHCTIYLLEMNGAARKALGCMTPFDPYESRRSNGARETGWAAWLPVVAAMAIMITGCLSTFLVLQLDEFRPKLGDIVAFKPGSQDTDMWQIAIPATLADSRAPSRATCVLDPNVMAEHGGSLVVEGLQRRPSLEYTVHWAGVHTATGGQDCGALADVRISRTDLQRLANAAGGFGVEKQTP